MLGYRSVKSPRANDVLAGGQIMLMFDDEENRCSDQVAKVEIITNTTKLTGLFRLDNGLIAKLKIK